MPHTRQCVASGSWEDTPGDSTSAAQIRLTQKRETPQFPGAFRRTCRLRLVRGLRRWRLVVPTYACHLLCASGSRGRFPLFAAVDHEDERLVRLDLRRRSLCPVAEVRRDHEHAASALLHADEALLPPLDDGVLAERHRERLPRVPAGVELLAGRPGVAGVVDGEGVAVLGART